MRLGVVRVMPHARANLFARQLCTAAERRARVRARIRAIDEQAAGRAMPLEDGGSLTSQHTTDELQELCASASVVELDIAPGSGRCFVLQHASVPQARLAELWLLNPLPVGRFDAGLNGSGGVGATLHGAATHAALPLACAEPLVTHVRADAQRGPGPGPGLPTADVEAVAALPGLCEWIASSVDVFLAHSNAYSRIGSAPSISARHRCSTIRLRIPR